MPKRKAASAKAAPKAKKAAATKADPITIDSDSDSDDGSDDNVEMRTEVVKGRAAVDNEFPVKNAGYKIADWHVLDEGGTVYDWMLNQTNISQNNNKFFIVQVLAADVGKNYLAWARWGRVGVVGQSNVLYVGPDKNVAIREATAKATAKMKKYTRIERDYGPMPDADAGKKKKAKAITKSKLPAKVQDFVKLIADVKMMEGMMKELGYDAQKLPLGKLSEVTVNKGYDALKLIAAEVNKKGGGDYHTLQTLSSEFYTVIPHAFGMRALPVIKTKKEVQEKLEMCQSLADITVAQKILKQAEVTQNPIDATFEKLQVQMTPLKKASKEFKLLAEYVKNTKGPTHATYELEIDEAYEMVREGEEERFEPFAHDPNRQLLWHGSLLSNFVGILSQGLRIAPPEAPVTGYMFDKGVYFADCVTKSANYCRVTADPTAENTGTGVLLLCEVALGDMEEMTHADYDANRVRKSAGKRSVKGLGRKVPDDAAAKELPKGCKVPSGSIVDADVDGLGLMYNEYIVYDTAQVKMRYALKMKFKFGGGRW